MAKIKDSLLDKELERQFAEAEASLETDLNASIVAEAKRRAEHRRRLLNVAALVPAALAAALYFYVQTTGFQGESSSYERVRLLQLVVALAAVAGVALVLIYLQTGTVPLPAKFRNASKRDESWDSVLEEQKDYIESLRAENERVRALMKTAVEDLHAAQSMNAKVGEFDKDALVADLKALLTKEAANEVLDEIRAQASVVFKRTTRDDELRIRFEESRGRLSRELHALTLRGNLNLALGSVTTVIGLYLLGTSVFQEISSATRDPWVFTFHFLPRFSLVVFIELFAFFFLALYKTSLQEIKYFQNELTNVEAKQIALRTAIEYGDAAMVKSIIDALAATERNHVLSKDQTTVELEKAKIDREGKGELVKALSELLKMKAEK